ncbi:Thiamine-monophosphate kinase [hydrothermal vent metagenome]|uniref:Thiamine-monophosphate kinase n=1 Tax=hydrothermal vent metagenome TaxID=652676 RepID=A0A3B0YE08_9ZZZZ
MKEFDFIEHISQPQHCPSLLMGIGDDAAVISANDQTYNLQVKLAHCQLDISQDSSINQSIECLKSLLVTTDIQKGYLFINLSLESMQEQKLKKYVQQLHQVLKQHDTVLAGGDTTHGCGTVIYQLVGYNAEDHH